MSDPLGLLQPDSSNRLSAESKDDWEEWEDDEVITPLTATTGEGPLLDATPGATENSGGGATRHVEQQASRRSSKLTVRHSVRGIARLTSRRRQKAQNAKFGIKLVTDMTKLRQQQQQQQQQRQQQQQQQQHVAYQMRQSPESRESRTGKFVDLAALRALEGAPSDESIGTFAWLRRKGTKGKKAEKPGAESSLQADLSPGARPIMIGFAMPPDSKVVISPQTAVVETPVEFPQYFKPTTTAPSPTQPVSAWSPDTEDGASPRMPDRGFVPAVPSIPIQYRPAEVSPTTTGSRRDSFPAPSDGKDKFRQMANSSVYVDDDDDDVGTPVTLFEEDGSPATTRGRSLRVIKGRQRSATNGSSRSQGWWDQVTSPFGSPTPPSAGSGGHEAEENRSWWNSVDKKKPLSPLGAEPEAGPSSGPRSVPRMHHQTPEITVEDVSSSSAPSSSRAVPKPQALRQAEPEKPRTTAGEVQTPGELPPPYSPPRKLHKARYRAVFPPGHPLNALYPPSPGPVPPGLSQTMTSQGAIGLSDVPLTPPPTQLQQQRLPDRPLGSFVPADHFIDVSGHGPRQRAERERRRHEKEDAVAWRAGRMWHGRGCFPCCGCFGCLGRPGREGRKRRRVCLGLCAAFLLLTALGVVLGVLLSRRTGTEETVPSRFLNLTDFPPIPTGISTVIGPESDSTTACVQPPTLWTCSLPKEQADSVAPFDASQPSFVIQIQFDNNTRQTWNVSGEPPRPTPTDRGTPLPLSSANSTRTTATPTASPRAVPATGFLGTSLVRRLLGPRDGPDSGSSLSLRPDPPPPSFEEMFFLGNTTDGVVSDDKAGEPTPFYISILRSINDTIGPDVLARRDDLKKDDDNDNNNNENNDDLELPGNGNVTAGQGIINASDIAPPPALDRDGTGAPAVLLPFPTQQPLRLYDRGLPTERYGFYTYFNKTTYVKSIAALSGDGVDATPVPADEDGGCLKTEAKFLVTWLSVRYKVEIWTRMGGDRARLKGASGAAAAAAADQQPGSFPYPVTVTLDTHGGQRGRKFAFVRGVDDRQRIIMDDARFVLNRMNTTGDLINGAADFNPSFGGMDGGTGGCKCEYRNWWRRNNKKKKRDLEPEPERIVTLAIETSCDDTCVAVLERRPTSTTLLFNSKVTSDNRKFGGIEPITAVSSHAAQLAPLMQAAAEALPRTSLESGLPDFDPVTNRICGRRRRPDFITVTRGPGLTSALSVGLTAAKGLAAAWQVPLIAVHHMQAHALTPRLPDPEPDPDRWQERWQEPEPAFPFLSLLVSGGHTQLLLSKSVTSHSILADARNVAIGDMLDKCARVILPPDVLAGTDNVMYGARLESFAFGPPPGEEEPSPPPEDPYEAYYGYTYKPPLKRRDEIRPYVSPTYGWTLTPPLAERRDMAFDFSGLGGQVQAIMKKNPDMDIPQRRELARETMRLAFEHLVTRHRGRLRSDQSSTPTTSSSVPKTLVVAGGVAANRFLQHILARMLSARGYPPDTLTIVRPPPEFCTDNAAMVAWAGMEMWEAGWYSDLNVLPQRRWSLDDGDGDGDGDGAGAGPGKGGILGLGGWLPRSQLENKDDKKAEAEARARERALEKLEKEIEDKAVGEGSKKKNTGAGAGAGAGAKAAPPQDWTIYWNDWNEKWGEPPEPGLHHDWAADWEDWDKFERRQRLRNEERRRERIRRWLESRKLTAWVGKLKKRQARKLERMRRERIKLKYQ
ncbi:glycoprotease family-domain-containing protein [Thermothelomyces heterothallicus CBS 202.75]|uniref:glycoprotease family-domain-containing protein n=1 Tax=Thermothelomyces heterothallicus CBS 202.75 TaxID=1149848 RepID=UPI00374489B5